ncbi:hypothetical protein ACE6H2_015430 [Prunus campanulata]
MGSRIGVGWRVGTGMVLPYMTPPRLVAIPSTHELNFLYSIIDCLYKFLKVYYVSHMVAE